MMTSTPARKLFLFLLIALTKSYCYYSSINICIPELSDESLLYLHKVSQQYPGVPLTIHVNPELNPAFECVQKRSWWEEIFSSIKRNGTETRISGLRTLKFLIGGGAISYCTIAYFIYRIYKIARKLNAMRNWWNNLHINSDHTHDDAMAELEKALFRTLKQNPCTNSERTLLKAYRRLNRVLISCGIRNLFQRDRELDLLVEKEITDHEYR